jgi:hypothetical protein
MADTEWTKEEQEKFLDELEPYIQELGEKTKDHPDSCVCWDCEEWWMLATK